MHYFVVCVSTAIALLFSMVSAASAQQGPTPVSPFPRNLSGTLVFQSDVRSPNNPTGKVKIYAMDLSSGAVSALTTGDWDDEQPRYSPDGSRIAFKSNRGGSYNLYVMDADGRNVARLTDHGGNDHDPSWLPDGQSLVFGSDRHRGGGGRSDLYQLWPADGRAERLTVFFEGNALMPSVSPDGGWVAFVAQTFPVDFGRAYQVHVLEIATRMTWPFNEAGPGCWPNWSPDGQSIAHVGARQPSNIQIVSSFGTSPQPIAGDPARWHYYPDWSPDSRLLAISVGPGHREGEDWDLALVDPSRAMPLQQLTTGAGNDRLPDWKPR